MSLNDLSYLYRQVIMDHAKNPRNFGQIASPDYQMELLNPTCGDAILVQVKVDADQVIEAIGYSGEGCSISIASASMMSLALQGKSLNQAHDLVGAFNHLVKGEEIGADLEKDLGDAALLEGVKQFPARYKCAVLAWKALDDAVKGGNKKHRIIEEE
ncbi:TPA: Fe-S cluster assembly sulfur transfer protein SufU [Streptococcus suis]